MNRPAGVLISTSISLLITLFFLVLPVAFGEESNPKVVQLYNTYCVQCHGIGRNGKGVNSRDMSVQPKDHTDAKGMGDIPDEELFHAIQNGGLSVNKSALMPAWGGVLSDRDINELVVYLRQVCKCGTQK